MAISGRLAFIVACSSVRVGAEYYEYYVYIMILYYILYYEYYDELILHMNVTHIRMCDRTPDFFLIELQILFFFSP